MFQFDNRPGLSRRDVIHESIQVANIADLVNIHHKYVDTSPIQSSGLLYLVQHSYVFLDQHRQLCKEINVYSSPIKIINKYYFH